MADPIEQFLPASEKDWTHYAPGPEGKMIFLKENPEWRKQQIAQADAHKAYLGDLMRRQTPWMLNPSLVGKGLAPSNSSDIMRFLSDVTIGQPYGLMSPPTTEDVKDADKKTRQVRGLLD